jgi:hypothetical protein
MRKYKQFTPKLVVAAYKATGLKPLVGKFYTDDGKCGCPITAVSIYKGIPFDELKKTISNPDGMDKLASKLNQTGIQVDGNYLDQFWVSFDLTCREQKDRWSYGKNGVKAIIQEIRKEGLSVWPESVILV